jgi:hypothetical protein
MNQFVAPSWSWASIPSLARLPTSLQLEFQGRGFRRVWKGDDFRKAKDTKVAKVHLEHSSDDPCLEVLSGFMKTSALCRPWQPNQDNNHSSRFDNP